MRRDFLGLYLHAEPAEEVVSSLRSARGGSATSSWTAARLSCVRVHYDKRDVGEGRILDSYFARHTERLSVRDEDLERLWNEDKIAVHYPDDSSGRQAEDSRSTEPTDYQGRAKTAIKYMKELEERGGYVWAESRVAGGVAKVGLVREGTGIKLEEARWEVQDDADALLRESGHTAVLKTLQLDKVLCLRRGQQMGLRAGRPQQGTIVHWHKCGTRLADLIEGCPPQPEWDNLSTEQQEATCAESLRLQGMIEDLPRLRYLLLPVGRTLEDVDIYGLTEDGREIFAQVTYLSRDSKAAQEKIGRLKAYDSDDAHLVFFGSGGGQRKEKGVVFVSVDEMWRWIDDNPDYRAALFPNT